MFEHVESGHDIKMTVVPAVVPFQIQHAEILPFAELVQVFVVEVSPADLAEFREIAKVETGPAAKIEQPERRPSRRQLFGGPPDLEKEQVPA